MTRFDEALQEFAERAEPEMRERVGAFSSQYLVVQEVGRGRTRRVVLQATAAVAVVAVVGAGAFYAAKRLDTIDPAAPAVNSIPWLGNPSNTDDPAFACGVPFPLGQGVTVATARQAIPALTQRVVVTDGTTVTPVDVSPGASTFPTESGVGVESAATWSGPEPQFWGLTNYGVLVDSGGNVASFTASGVNINASTGAVTEGTDAFVSNACTTYSDLLGPQGTLYLDGPYTVHIVTQLWVDNVRNPVAMWVDEDLPNDAQVTFDWDAYQAQLDAQAAADDEEFQQVKQLFADSDTTLATLEGTGVIAGASMCTVADTLANGGAAAVGALPAPLPVAPITFTTLGFEWPYTDDASDPQWESAGDLAMVFFDQHGTYVTTAPAHPASTVESPDGTTSSAHFYDFPGCDGLGLPIASGSYDAYLVVEDPSLEASLAPDALADLGNFKHVSSWIPAGEYTVP